MTPRVLRAATRASPLALWQAEEVRRLLRVAHPGLEIEFVSMTAAPDRNLSQPLSEIGGKGAFAKEVQVAVLEGRADFAVHSAKDLPSTTVEGLVLAAVPERGDARDVLVGSSLRDLREGTTVATGSARRRVQLAALRPDLRFVGLRGNIQRRVGMAGTDGIEAVIAAGVALQRQGMADRIDHWFTVEEMIPQVGQGAMAVECRADDAETIELVRTIEDPGARAMVDAERSFLVALGGDCDYPAGAHATRAGDGIALVGMVSALDGSALRRATVSGADGAALGPELLAALTL